MANSETTDHTIHQEQSHLGLLFAHITLPKKNSVKTDQTVPSGVVWTVLFYFLR